MGGRDRGRRGEPGKPGPHHPQLSQQREGLGRDTGGGDSNHSPSFWWGQSPTSTSTPYLTPMAS